MKFGEKIIIDHKLRRVTDYNSGSRKDKKYWKKEMFKELREVIVIGERTLSEGFREWEDELGFMYYPERYFKVLLVAMDMKHNPFYIIHSSTESKN